MRLIDADAEGERLQKQYCEECTRKGNYGIFGAACTPCWVMDAVEEFENAPTIDAEPVRHGRWIVHTTWHGMFGLIHSECSECKFDRNGDLSSWKFCPNCGAKMSGGADNGAVD